MVYMITVVATAFIKMGDGLPGEDKSSSCYRKFMRRGKVQSVTVPSFWDRIRVGQDYHPDDVERWTGSWA